MAKIYQADLHGTRESKYNWLNENSYSSINWNILSPSSPYYFLVPHAELNKALYKSFAQIQDIFPVNNVGIVTARDKFAIDFEKDVLKRRIVDFTNLKLSDDFIKTTYRLKDTSTFKLSKFREKLSKEEWENYFTKILYRPFDKRNICYSRWIIERPIYETMKHFFDSNLGLLYTRPLSPNYEFSILISADIIDQCIVGNKSAGAGISYVAPLYTYPQTDKKDLFSDHESEEKKPNINEDLIEQLNQNFKKSPRASVKKSKGEFEITPEQIFYYIYAVLYSNTYRTKYAEFLKIDFPRVPFTKNYKLFLELGKLGNQLADLHLLKDEAFKTTISKFPIKGTNKVEKPKYKEEKVYINNDQYFDGVKEEIWNYQIGGYQVCEKWLKDRKERPLTVDEIQTYCKIVTALSKTIEIQNQIDKLYPEVEKTL